MLSIGYHYLNLNLFLALLLFLVFLSPRFYFIFLFLCMYISLIWAKLPEINMMDGWMDRRTDGLNSPTLASHCVTTSWLAATTQMRAREPNVPPQDFTPEPFLSQPCRFFWAWNRPTVCWIAYSVLGFYQ